MIHHGDCLEVMAAMEPESVDAVVTDPPYGLEFMGKAWDKLDIGLPQEKVWKGRRGQGGASIGTDDSKPGSRHHVGYGGGQQGFKRCTICGKRAFSGSPCQCPEPQWVVEYAQAAPSSAVRMQRWHEQWAREAYRVAKPSAYLLAFGGTRTVHRMAVAIEDAGWIIRDMLVWAYASGFPKSKASLKPAWEPIVMARKPGPLRMLAIDSCRILTDEDFYDGQYERQSRLTQPGGGATTAVQGVKAAPLGRWPANVILTATEDGRAIFDGDVDGVVGGGESEGQKPYDWGRHAADGAFPLGHMTPGYGDSGTYSRFFLIPKADRSDREPVLGGPTKVRAILGQGIGGADNLGVARANHHPTVKPTELMRHLVRLVTPAGGTVLDPFLGSGTTGIACELEGFPWIGIEKEADYVAIAEARLNGTQRGMGLAG